MHKNIPLVVGIIILFLGTCITSSTGIISETSFIYKPNNPPYEPSDPIPPDGTTNIPLDMCVSCTGGDPDGDLVWYNIYLGNITPPPGVIFNTSSTTYCTWTLEYNTTYYWKVISIDEHGATTEGPIWRFKTKGISNSSIQDLIDNASDGDTIYIPPGIYYENILIDKSISLLGEGKNTTVIDGNKTGDVIYISSDWVNISGFTIQNSGDKWYYAGINVNSNYTIITDNIIISNNVTGISLSGNFYYGFGHNNTIKGNYISNNKAGIGLYYSINNTIIDNTIIWNTYSGIAIAESFSNIPGKIISNDILYNNISYNNDGIYGDSISHLKIIGNHISNNKKCAINILGGGYITIEGNNIEKSEYGLALFSSSFNIIRKNNFINNIKWNAGFELSIGNRWIYNYWDDWIGVKIKQRFFQRLPKIIWWPGYLPNFDWHPAKEPYDI